MRCRSLECLPLNMKYLTALKTLDITYCENLILMECEEDIQGLKSSVREVLIEKVSQLVALPRWLQGAANTIQFIRIEHCHKIKGLPVAAKSHVASKIGDCRLP